MGATSKRDVNIKSVKRVHAKQEESKSLDADIFHLFPDT